MKYSITIDGQEHTLELIRGDVLSCRFDESPFAADAIEIQPGVYSVLLGTKSFTVRVAPGETQSDNYELDIGGSRYAVSVRDPRRRSRSGATPSLAGKQNIKALMPGKVVRVLVTEGQAVQIGEGLAVVEAMKMQNELKCPKAGMIQKILIAAGQTVNAGDILIVVD